ncbi:RHS repeat-associated core domain-containing protein [Frigidibacter sp. SD6-1]|uniref:RHS repeat domain-containing protein n=1 Tax=Frigidibacter sp. SD6-1 TaxID=3032581 RepID=UPI0024DFABDA|nr:RHS repeat-associated core domain-containing protein [Frigidibacter sp. SD6-1]
MDGLGSVRAVTDAAGARSETALYRPYGEEQEQTYTALLNESRGYIGERYDADAGLQYLNARYYDPRLGMFLQPDWWEVMILGGADQSQPAQFPRIVGSLSPMSRACLIAMS